MLEVGEACTVILVDVDVVFDVGDSHFKISGRIIFLRLY